ncbi:MAG: DUF5335 family protein [Rudaea sp.]
MQTREIPRDQWVSFLDGFSRQHEGWLSSIEVTQDGQRDKIEARDLPLVGIAASIKHGDKDTMDIILGKGTENFTHNLSGVKHIRLQQNDRGEDAGLEFDASDGSKAVLTFRTPASPASVDDVSRARR